MGVNVDDSIASRIKASRIAKRNSYSLRPRGQLARVCDFVRADLGLTQVEP